MIASSLYYNFYAKPDSYYTYNIANPKKGRLW